MHIKLDFRGRGIGTAEYNVATQARGRLSCRTRLLCDPSSCAQKTPQKVKTVSSVNIQNEVGRHTYVQSTTDAASQPAHDLNGQNAQPCHYTISPRPSHPSSSATSALIKSPANLDLASNTNNSAARAAATTLSGGGGGGSSSDIIQPRETRGSAQRKATDTGR